MAKRTTTTVAAPAAVATESSQVAAPAVLLLAAPAPAAVATPAGMVACGTPAPRVPAGMVAVAKVVRTPTDSGKTQKEVDGNRAMVAALVQAGITGQGLTGAALASVAGFAAPITTAWVQTLATRNKLQAVYNAGLRNRYTYALVALPGESDAAPATSTAG